MMNLITKLNSIGLKAKKKKAPLSGMDRGASGPLKMSGIMNQAIKGMKLKMKAGSNRSGKF